MKLRSLITIFLLFSAVSCVENEENESQLDDDVFLKFKDGNSATIYRQESQVVFKLCKHNTDVFDRHCDNHYSGTMMQMRYIDYKRQLFEKAGIEPPYNFENGKEKLTADIARIESGLSLLSHEERDLAEQSLKEMRRLLGKFGDSDLILDNLNEGMEIARPEIPPEVESDAINGADISDAFILNEKFRTKLFNLAFAPFDKAFPSLYLPRIIEERAYFLDTHNGMVWQKITGKRNWYDAAEVERVGNFEYPVALGCKATLGGEWRLPYNPELGVAKNSGISKRFTVGDIWFNAPVGSNRQVQKEVFCVARFEDVYLSDDYDGDGVVNSEDRCHLEPRGAPVDQRGCESHQKPDQWNRTEAEGRREQFVDHWLDTRSGIFWQYLGVLNWYDAVDKPRVGDIRGVVKQGCKSKYGTSWRLPSYAEQRSAENMGISAKFSGTGLSWFSSPVGNPKDVKTSYCVAKFEDVYKNYDYDGDGVLNHIDKCHSNQRGTSVNQEGCEENQSKDAFTRPENHENPRDPSNYWLDAYTGKIWSHLGSLNWYDAMDKRRDEPVSGAIRPGCKRAYTPNWSVPGFFQFFEAEKNGIRNAGIPIDLAWTAGTANLQTATGRVVVEFANVYKRHTGYWPPLPGEGAKRKREVNTTICVANLLEVHPKRDYDQDGVINELDMCHASAIGLQVDQNGCEEGQPQDNWGAGAGRTARSAGSGLRAGKRCRVNGYLDDDCDGVSNGQDRCPNTREGDYVYNPGESKFQPRWHGCAPGQHPGTGRYSG